MLIVLLPSSPISADVGKGKRYALLIGDYEGAPLAGQLALILGVARPGENWRVFSTNEFRPPRDPADWKYGDPNNLPAAGKQKK